MSRPKPGSLASRLGGDDATVLVVEDEPDIANFLGAFFRASGTEVVHLDPATAAEVVELAAELSVACALVDLNLSGLTGFEVIAAMNADERVQSVPVLIVTADARPATQEKAAALGAVGFIPKPFNVKDVFTTVSQFVDDHRAALEFGDEDEAGEHHMTGSLISADGVSARLTTAVAAGRRDHTPTTFALIRIGGTPPSPAVVGEIARRVEAGASGAAVLGATAADELAVLFDNDTPNPVAHRLLSALGDGKLDVDLGPGRSVAITVHIGLAASPAHAGTGEELYMAADVALADAIDADEALVTSR